MHAHGWDECVARTHARTWMLLHSSKSESVVGQVVQAEERRTARPRRRRKCGDEEEEEGEEVLVVVAESEVGEARAAVPPRWWAWGLRRVVGVEGGSAQSKSLTLREPQRRRERTHMPGRGRGRG